MNVDSEKGGASATRKKAERRRCAAARPGSELGNDEIPAVTDEIPALMRHSSRSMAAPRVCRAPLPVDRRRRAASGKQTPPRRSAAVTRLDGGGSGGGVGGGGAGLSGARRRAQVCAADSERPWDSEARGGGGRAGAFAGEVLYRLV